MRARASQLRFQLGRPARHAEIPVVAADQAAPPAGSPVARTGVPLAGD
jgi:hypothetical protein